MGSPPERLFLVVWRISNHADLSGRGGLIVSGRWHTYPHPIVYCSDEAHTAFREVMKPIGQEYLLPDSYVVPEIKCPRSAAIEEISLDDLRPDWAADGAEALLACRAIGDAWLRSGRSPLLKVPSAARPGSSNYLINPVHRDADHFQIVRQYRTPFPDWVRHPAAA